MKLMTVTPPSDNRIAQLIDANLDRAREGLRVMEDWCRFGLKRKDFSIQIKHWRQQLGKHHHSMYRKARRTSTDPGIGISHPLQQIRSAPEEVFIANSSRVQEALRVIEEFTRITDPKLSELATKIRYETYEIEIRIIKAKEGLEIRNILKDCSICFITSTNQNLKEIVLQALKAGIKIVQYREKLQSDYEKVNQARDLAALCKKYNSLFIVNDRIDIALAVDADGIHLGQKDMPTNIARKIIGSEKIIGRSTHSIEEIKRAEEEGCDYIGIGPIFQSKTKKDLSPVGTSYLREGLNITKLPAFAIGGINNSNLDQLKSITNIKIAVSDAITNCNDPFSKTKELLKLLA